MVQYYIRYGAEKKTSNKWRSQISGNITAIGARVMIQLQVKSGSQETKERMSNRNDQNCQNLDEDASLAFCTELWALSDNQQQKILMSQ